MIVYLSLDPEVFSETVTNERANAVQITTLLKAIKENLNVLVDCSGKIENSYKEAAHNLACGVGRGPAISILLTDILKDKSKRRIVYKVIQTSQPKDIVAVFEHGSGDFLVGCEAKEYNLVGEKFVKIWDYDISLIESYRAKFMKCEDSLDCMELHELEEMISRTVIDSERVIIVDKHIGATESNYRGFKQGLAFFLKIWDKSFNKRGAKRLTLEVVTHPVIGWDRNDTNDDKKRVKMLNAQKADITKKKIFEQAIRDSGISGIDIIVSFKHDNTGLKLLHDRFFVTARGCFKPSLGFDFFNNEGKACRQWINVESNREKHITDCFGLPDALEPMKISVPFSNRGKTRRT